ncbi:diaminopimelate epimerase [Undibacterium sp. SXout7W]|uniref:diaminopimelate epimerase n=1 Tax=Undibacterium sp. SXout7W TaxID=3413049 RepID=UPI003BF2AF26
MERKIKFTKMHGLGNDFLLVEEDHVRNENLGQLATIMCNRRTGVGADGLLVLGASSEPRAVSMRIFNPDGSESSMCGNGIRCVAHYAYGRGICRYREFAVHTLAGRMQISLRLVSDDVVGVSIDMGVPVLNTNDIPAQLALENLPPFSIEYAGSSWNGHALRVSVPHAVIFLDTLDQVNVAEVGAFIERHAFFPEGINVNFAQHIGKDRVRLHTWERGAGLVLACGSGACATVVAANELSLTGPQVTVEVALGELLIERSSDGRILMTGPARYVFDGNFHLMGE